MSQAKSFRYNPANAWCFTLNNFTENEHGALVQRFRDMRENHGEDIPYWFIIGKEVGDNGTPHLQGYIKMKDPHKRFRPCPKFAIVRDGKQAIHWEKAKCGMDVNYNYCKKDGDYITNMPAPYMTLSKAKEVLADENSTMEDKDRASLHVAWVEDYHIMKCEWQQVLKRAYDKMCRIYYADPVW